MSKYLNPISPLFLIAGLILLIAPYRAAAADTPTEREVTFDGPAGVRLAGTLTLPSTAMAKQHTLPGLILVAGSGPTDRNGNQLPTFKTDLLKQIATVLAQNGVASLRFDKRGVGGSTPFPTDREALAKFCAWEDFVADTKAAFRCLQSQPEIDPNRSGMLGHSEGGILVLQAASDMKDVPHPPAALILASTPGRSLDLVIQDQIARLLKIQHATDEQTKFFLDKNRAICAAIRTTGVVPTDVPAGLAALYPAYLGEFLHGAFAVVPADLAAAFPGPVLVVQGEKDVQVSPISDAPALNTALSRRHPDDHELFVAPNTSHNLKLVSSDADPAIAGDLSPGTAAKISSWAARALLTLPAR